MTNLKKRCFIKQCLKKLTPSFLLITLFSCSDGTSVSNQKEVSKEVSTENFIRENEKFPKKQESLNAIAYQIAINRGKLKNPMIRAMKNSAITENIVNISKDIRNKKKGKLSSYITALENLSFNSKNSKSKESIQLSKIVAEHDYDINTYFPVDEHRKNVLEKGEDFLGVADFIGYDSGKDDYLALAYDQNGNEVYLSSRTVPKQNILVVDYSENQALAKRAPPRDDGGGGGATITYSEGLRVINIKTHGITDGWLGGDLELVVQVLQSAVNIGGIYLSAYIFMDTSVYRHHGHWYWTWTGRHWREHHHMTAINRYRRWSSRQNIAGIYNDTFL